MIKNFLLINLDIESQNFLIVLFRKYKIYSKKYIFKLSIHEVSIIVYWNKNAN